MGKYQGYEKYKDSGVEWLGEIPEHWQSLKIKRLTAIKRGASPRPIDDPKYFDDDGEYAWVRIADVTASERYLETTTQKVSQLGKSFSVPLEPGKLFLSIAGSVGKPIITKIKCCIHDGFVYFPDLKVNEEFIYYIFNSGQPYLGLGKLGTQLNLNTETVGAITIGLPPLDEQETIAQFLDHKTKQIDDLIAKKETLIEKLDEKRTALISHAVTKGLNPSVPMKDSGIEWLGEIPKYWKRIPFRWCCYITEGQVDPTQPNFKVLPLIAPNHIESQTGKLIAKESAEDQGAISGKYFYKSGTLLYSKIRPALVKACISDEDGLCSADMYPIKTADNLSNEFMLYQILSKNFTQLAILVSDRVAMPKVNRETLGGFPIIVPPLKEQQKITEYLDKKTAVIDQQKAKIKEAIERLKEYRTALITNAVTGKIDVRQVPIP